MKKYAITLAAFLLLTGCGSTKNEKKASNETETTSVTNAVTTEATTAKTTAKTTTTTVSAAAKKTTAKTTAAKTTSVTTAAPASTTSAVNNSEANDNTAGNTPAPQPAEKHYTPYGEEIPEAEWNGICTVREKYGLNFKVTARFLCWESWPERIIEEDGTEFVTHRDTSEPLKVYYEFECDDGTKFGAYINENTDVVVEDNFLCEKYKEQLTNEASELFRKLVPDCKAGIYIKHDSVPFECSADMTYEEFRQAFADNGGTVIGNLYVTDDIEVTEDLTKYSYRQHRRKRGEFGYYCRLTVDKLSQEDYDSLEGIIRDSDVIWNMEKTRIL